MQKCDTLINAAYIVTQNDSRDVLSDSSLAIDSGTIQAIGPSDIMKNQWVADKVIEFPKSVLMPGLINAHTHAAMTFLRGFADDLPLLEWLESKISPVEARLRPEIVRLGSMLGYAEMLACGVTACVDMYLFENAVLEAADYAGIRCLGGEAVFAFPTPACQDYKAALARTEELAEQYANSKRIRVAVNPHSVYTTTAEILNACRSLALKLNLPLHIHLAESEMETANTIAMHGMRPVEWCERNGLFDCTMLAAHLVDVTAGEINTLALNGVHAIHNPASNMKLASGIAPVPDMLAAGMAVGLGTDGPASNNTLNLFREMKLAALLHKVNKKDSSTLAANQILDMATIHGATIFGDSTLGVLAPGKAADCIALNLDLPHMRPVYSPISQIVYAAGGHECQMTMIDGEIVYQDGKFSRFELASILEEIDELKEFVSAR